MLGANAGQKKEIFHKNKYIKLVGNSFLSLLPSKEAKRKSLEAIRKMGLSDKVGEPVRRLSGGQQRRVATARTLAQEPVLILADEFLSELDDETMTVVLKRVVEYIRNNNAALLVVEHDISRAKSMADRLLVIDDGRINPFITEVTMIEVKV
jgi:ABC-type phosphate/phosphonate transport system ATPase subunit